MVTIVFIHEEDELNSWLAWTAFEVLFERRPFSARLHRLNAGSIWDTPNVKSIYKPDTQIQLRTANMDVSLIKIGLGLM